MENNQDMFKMFEQARALSQMMNMVNGTNQETSKNDIDKAEKAVEMVKLFSIMNENYSAKMEKDITKENNVKAKYFDDEIMSMELRSIKSAIPFLDNKYQKPMGMFIKLIEIQKLMDIYSDKATTTSGKRDENWKREMLMAIRVHMDDEKKNKIDKILKALDMSDIMMKMKEVRT